jgi:hypothetical protein
MNIQSLRRLSIAWATILLAIAGTRGEAAPPAVEFELVTPQAQAQLSAQQWLRALTELHVSGVRIRQARAGDRAGIDTSGTASRPKYKVIGILNQRNELELPGGRFSLSQQSQLGDWIKQLQEQGPPGAPRKRIPFGLEPEQLKLLDAALAKPLDVEVKGQRCLDAVGAVRRRTGLPITVDPPAEAALEAAGPVGDALRGLACGTCLAAVVRPAGMAVVPRAGKNGSVELVITRPGRGTEIWPIGFPAEDKRQKLAPLLFESINVEIEGNPLAQALAAIEARLQMPFLFDYSALAAEQIDLDKTTVSLPAKKLSYSIILRKLLGQARLNSELRTDDAGKPFLWITTFRQQPNP